VPVPAPAPVPAPVPVQVGGDAAVHLLHRIARRPAADQGRVAGGEGSEGEHAPPWCV
jgi:hypothetical protein